MTKEHITNRNAVLDMMNSNATGGGYGKKMEVGIKNKRERFKKNEDPKKGIQKKRSSEERDN